MGANTFKRDLNAARPPADPRCLARMIESEAVSPKLPAHPRGRAAIARDAGASLYYGGQAVMDGVMIRGPHHMAIAVRAPGGDIVRHSEALAGVYTGWPRRIPIVRGIVVLYETLALGIRALNWSTQVALGRGDEETSKVQLIASLAVTLVFVVAIFFAGPVLITSWLGHVIGNDYLEVAIEGVLRLAMFIGYIWLIGRSSDIQRVFAYHGAEHRAIHAYEDGRDLTPAAVREYPNAHPRCGTAFLLTVMVISLVVFVLLGAPPIWLRLIERIVLIPVIAAIAYEVLRLGQRFGERGVFGLIYRPNIWLQSLTTRDPDDAQIEVAIAALEQVIALESGSPPAEQLRTEGSNA
ncbi:MAG: DUF1385 domain-containing protein [Chloroflexota bacterium]|nr:DUF1385 domain-containing protein [Chloroflexota bacterium]